MREACDGALPCCCSPPWPPPPVKKTCRGEEEEQQKEQGHHSNTGDAQGPPLTRRGGRNIVQTERSIKHYYFQMRKNNYLHTVFSFLNFDVPHLFLVVAHQDQEGTTQVYLQKAAAWLVA